MQIYISKLKKIAFKMEGEKMKKIGFFAVMFILSVGLFAQRSVATTDNFLAAKINPAAMGYGNAGGIGFVFPQDENIEFGDKFDMYLNGENSGYLMMKNGDNYQHRITFGEGFKNLYFGYAWDWENKKFLKGDLEISTLYRPSNSLSLGLVMQDLANYKFGVAARPTFLGSKVGKRFTITADVEYQDQLVNPVIGLETELLDGFTVAGCYNLDTEEIGLNFGLNFGKLQIGSMSKITDDDNFAEPHYYVSTSDKIFPSFLRKKKSNGIYDFKVKGSVVEKKQGNKFGKFVFISDKNITLEQLLKKIEKLKNDDAIEGIIFRKTNISASFANLVEIKKALLDFKSTGKKIIFYKETYGNIGYAFAASVADEIYLYKTGSINLRGIAINSPYIKELMDKLGVKMENFRSHKYKTAGNMFSETEMTEAERESYSYLLDGLYDEMKKMIAEGRSSKLKLSVDETIDNGPYFIAENALEMGLVDGLIYEDELEGILKDKFNNSKITKQTSGPKANTDWYKAKQDRIAVIYAIGNIHLGEGQPGRTIGSGTTAKAIRKARKDKSIKGIVLCVNSGGGSALASDIIAREVELCKDGENKKPIVALMTGTAASGGYYISAKADKIIAQPTTITGSIGVIGMLFNLEGLYEKIGVNWSSVKKGNFSDIGTTNRALNSEEKKIISESIEHIYWQFVDVVAEGRNLTRDEVHEIARGRVWTGKQAMERGLVDMMGGMDTAIEELKQLANLKNDIKMVEFKGYNKANTYEINLGFAMQANLPTKLQMLKDLNDEMKMYENENVLMMMPKLEVK